MAKAMIAKACESARETVGSLGSELRRRAMVGRLGVSQLVRRAMGAHGRAGDGPRSHCLPNTST